MKFASFATALGVLLMSAPSCFVAGAKTEQVDGAMVRINRESSSFSCFESVLLLDSTLFFCQPRNQTWWWKRHPCVGKASLVGWRAKAKQEAKKARTKRKRPGVLPSRLPSQPLRQHLRQRLLFKEFVLAILEVHLTSYVHWMIYDTNIWRTVFWMSLCWSYHWLGYDV